MIKIAFLNFVLIIVTLCNVFSQNEILILNGDFEKFKPQEIEYSGRNTVNFNAVKGWTHGGSHTFYCNCDLKNKSSTKYTTDCKEGIARSNNGCGYISLVFIPDCIDQLNPPFIGCSSFISTKLMSTLELGKQYHLSMDIFIPEQEIIDSLFPNQIGVKFTNEAPTLNLNTMALKPNGSLRDYKINQWFEYNLDFIPTCFINYLTIGTFRSDIFPSKFRLGSNFLNQFYIDNIQLVETKNETIINNFLECIPFEKEKFENDSIVVYFDINDSSLSEKSKTTLDSIGKMLKRDKESIWKISGHTDNTGIENFILSQNRTLSVLNYICNTYKIPNSRFDTVSMSSASPVTNNITESNRRLNRRVEIIKTKNKILSRLYERLQNPHEIVVSNNLLIDIIYYTNSKSIQNPGILAGIKNLQKEFKTNKGKQLSKSLKLSYKYLTKPELAFTIDSLYGIWLESYFSHEIPNFVLNNGLKLIGWYPFKFLNEKSERVDYQKCSSVVIQIRKILDQKIPTVNEVGTFTSLIPFLILSFENDNSFKKYLPTLLRYCSEGLFYWPYYAFLYDYSAIISNEKPLYNSFKNSADYSLQYQILINNTEGGSENQQNNWLLKYNAR